MTSLDDPEKPEKIADHSITNHQAPESRTAGSNPTAGIKMPRQVRSDSLLQGDRELQIIHGDEIYRLSVTRQGKLILHK